MPKQSQRSAPQAGREFAVADRGRPSVYSQELADKICELLATGMTLREVCKAEGMPAESTVRNWALTDHEGFFAHYDRAREIGYHAMADETIDIADNGTNDWMARNGGDDEGWATNGEHIQRSRLRIDTRKWLLAKALPKVYGERMNLEHGGRVEVPITGFDIRIANAPSGDADKAPS